jgi:hypothetical protein
MKSWLAVVAVALSASSLACGDAGTVQTQKKPSSSTGAAAGSNGSTHSTSTSTSGTHGATGTTGLTSGIGSNGTTGQCVSDGTYVGTSSANLCCSGAVDNNGYCTPSSAGASGSGTTTASGTTGTVATGTTTGGTCPNNVPNISNGVTQNSGACQQNELGEYYCTTPGFSCVNGQCVLNGANGGVQVTLSFDDSEDFDLHVIEPEPSGPCEIYYGNRGPQPYPDGGSNPNAHFCSVGWLDRDSNAACSLDNVNIENVIYPPNVAPPSGTYKVLVDYWEDCDNASSSNYAVQVRANGQIFEYCGTLTRSEVDHGSAGSGHLVTTFTIP